MKPSVVVRSGILFWAIATGAAAQQNEPQNRRQNEPQDIQQNAVADQAPRYRYWDTNWEFEDIDVGSIVDRLGGIGIEIPFEVDGNVTVKFKVSVPLNAIRTGQAYKIDGHIESPDLVVGPVALTQFDSDVSLTDGVLSLSQTQGFLADRKSGDSGAFRGDIRATLIADDDQPKPISINAAVETIPIGPIANLILGIAPVQSGVSNDRAETEADSGADSIAGLASGKILFRGDLRRLSEVQNYRTKGNLRVEQFVYGSLPSMRIQSGEFGLIDGELSVPSLTIRATDGSDIALVGSIDASLVDDRPFDVSLRGNDVPLSPWSTLLGGKMDLDIAGRGSIGKTIQDGHWNVSGRIASPSISIAGQSLGVIEHRVEISDKRIVIAPLGTPDASAAADVKNVDLQRFEADYAITDSQFVASKIDASLYGGTIGGNASIGRTDDQSHAIDLTWDQIAPRIDRSLIRYFIGSIVEVIPGVGGGLEKTAVSLETSGAIRWNVPVNRFDDPSAHRGSVQIAADSILLGRSKIGQIELALSSDGASIDLTVDGTLFGGNISVQSDAPIGAPIDAPIDGGAANWSGVASDLIATTVMARGIKVGRLMPLIRPKDSRRYRGEINVALDNRSKSIDASIENFMIGEKTISRRLVLEATLDGDRIEIRQFAGRYAGGQIIGSGQWGITDDRPRRLGLRLSNVDAGLGLRPITGTIAGVFGGRVSGPLTISPVGTSISIAGRLTCRDTEVVGLPLGEMHTPLQVNVGPSISRWSARFPSIRGNSHGGLIVGDLAFQSAAGGVGFDMDGEFGARHVDVGEVLAEAGMTSSLARGDISGGLAIGGKRIAGLNDLRGRFSADLETATGAAIPGLSEASRFFTGLSLGSARLTGGNIEGTIGKGAIEIEEFVAKNEQLLVVADGRIGMRDLRMDMGIVISTGQFTTTTEAAPALIRRFAINSILPGATLLEIGRLISNRTVFLSMTGPVNRPVVQLKPVETAQAALRRLAIEQIIPLITGGVTGDAIY